VSFPRKYGLGELKCYAVTKSLRGSWVPHPTPSLSAPTSSQRLRQVGNLTSTKRGVWLPRRAGAGAVCRRPLLGSIRGGGRGPGPPRGVAPRWHRTVEPGKALLQDPACVGDPFWGRSGWWEGSQAHGEASCHVGTGRSSLERLSYRGTLGGECRGVRGSSGRCQVRHLTPCPDGHAADGGQRRWWVPLLHPPCQSGGGLVRCISQRTQRWEFSSFVVLVGQHDGL